ncbi:MAG: hypothetical protein KBB52_00265 [Candidatus Omnitrophica bacterium]|nr:hypothetical protein [Candidatus Omnitrophota bacterium]
MYQVDTYFDFRLDAHGKDPDTHSPALRSCHKLLWSKPLPGGKLFELVERGAYLYYKSEVKEFCLSSDAVIPTFRWNDKIQNIIAEIPDEFDRFSAIGYTIGGMMVFPALKVGRKWTINQARGCHPRIKDRFDLTVECIRRYYLPLPDQKRSPLLEVLARYDDFFNLFKDFRGYVKFFLLQDIVNDECTEVQFFAPFDDFKTSPLPQSKEAYERYMKKAIEFIEARNKRIREYRDWCKQSEISGRN